MKTVTLTDEDAEILSSVLETGLKALQDTTYWIPRELDPGEWLSKRERCIAGVLRQLS